MWNDAIAALKNTGDVAAFVNAVGPDLVKDFRAVQALPGAAAFESWLGYQLVGELGKAGLSPTLAALVLAGVKTLAAPAPAAPGYPDTGA
jgi:hypothetical protein